MCALITREKLRAASKLILKLRKILTIKTEKKIHFFAAFLDA